MGCCCCNDEEKAVDYCYLCGSKVPRPAPLMPNPNPRRFEIWSTEQIGNALIANVYYEDCVNYEGHKLMVYADTREDEFRARKVIDPHFRNDDESPIARFEPTEGGWWLARIVARRVSTIPVADVEESAEEKQYRCWLRTGKSTV